MDKNVKSLGIVSICFFVLLATATIFLPSCKGCAQQDDEELIQQLVENAVVYAQQHEIGELMDLATKDFVANPGSHQRRSTKALLMVLFRRFGKFSIVHPVSSITIENSGTAANLSVPFLLVREGQAIPDMRELVQQPGQWLKEAGEVAHPYYLTAKLVKVDGDWLVASVQMKGTQNIGY